ncbi:MAG: chromophore lyase CpcT/CpeT [Chroococcidiopsidaceae cyanobacterium CP_BM_ER_R8_30]|nr:chromophore lyase CpcT/CpeT [Chroococcidiopsidaceae cyanobacterium CP_BM_ER_R8_30]
MDLPFSPELIALARYLTGEFDNQEQALAEPAWYVHLRLWQRPVPLFTEDSITLFAEQASVINLDRPYRQRLMRLQGGNSDASLQVQYYMPKQPDVLLGGGRNPALLETLSPDQFELLPGCLLTVTQQQIAPNHYHFSAALPPEARCCFTYNGQTTHVSLGFEAREAEFLSYDKGIDPATGKALWGAILGPFRFHKR